ncbi:hypothetical protein N7470_010320 [Penicillium chermesinum]|nr:hypothetical protein N7470_010320 [Penicillium chermesinum]
MASTPARASSLLSNLTAVSARISTAVASSPAPAKPVRLVAVSKLKPASDILALHQAPASQQHFGENYLQELLEKSRLLPKTIKWHFIGGLQSNKCVNLARDVHALWAVESVDSEKKATLLNKGWGDRKPEVMGEREESDAEADKLRIYVQVNTSGEENKAGIDPAAAPALSKATTPENENEDFVCLRDTRDRVAAELGLGVEELELSMGMSSDFEGAIALGSDQVRVGTTIFGDRPPKSEARIV